MAADAVRKHGSYRDFVPNRFRGFVPPPILTPAPGAVVLTSTGAFRVEPSGRQVVIREFF